MALTKCKECGKEISDRAEVCPHCGVKRKKPTSLLTWIAAIVIGVPLFLAIVGGSGNRSSSPVTKEPPDLDRIAGGACMLFIKKQLHDPSSAEFAHSSESIVRVSAPRAVVTRSVRAKNAFGAMRLAEYTCLLDLGTGDGVRLISLSQGRASEKAINEFLAGR